ncbi:MAG: aromatic amino acid transport family protein [Candidatus Pacearchaeota archaeon]
MVNKRFWATAFTLSGTIIGAGILGLPYVFAEAGFLIGLFWMVFLGAIILLINLSMAEVTLKTKGNHQLTGYAEIYLGKWGKRIMFFATIFGIYSALLAYLVGESRSFSQVLPGNLNPLILGIVFWVLMNFLVREGLRGLKKMETYAVLTVIVMVFFLFIRFAPQIQVNNLLEVNLSGFFIPMGVVLFALLGFTSIPKLREEIRGSENLLKKAVFVGSIIPILLNLIFSAVFVGVLGKSVTEVATLSFGGLVNVIGIFTMFCAYLVLSFVLKDTFKYDLKISGKLNFFFYSVVPLILYLFVEVFGLLGFTSILGVGGCVSAGLTGILIVVISYRAKRLNK